MSLAVDFILIAFLFLGALAGFRKGIIKTAVGFIGLIAIVIISYALKNPIADFMITNLPFFDFDGLNSLNILIYNVAAFAVVFIVLYCVLNIIMSITGFVDTLLKFTIIWAIPSKIGGAILGLLEAWIFLFLIVFVAGSFNVTAKYLIDSKVSNAIINHTPVLGNYLSGVTKSANEIYKKIDESKDEERKELNLAILQLEIQYQLITKEKAQELVDIDKVNVGNIAFGLGDTIWSNI